METQKQIYDKYHADRRETARSARKMYWGTSTKHDEAVTKHSSARRSQKWGRSSAGRAPALQAGGQEFDSPRLHHNMGL